MRIIDLVQKAIDGGWPLDNDSAHHHGIGHGTPLVLLQARELVAFLMRVRAAGGSSELLGEVDRLLAERDTFMVPVSADEGKG